jgi:hypothetical protein
MIGHGTLLNRRGDDAEDAFGHCLFEGGEGSDPLRGEIGFGHFITPR